MLASFLLVTAAGCRGTAPAVSLPGAALAVANLPGTAPLPASPTGKTPAGEARPGKKSPPLVARLPASNELPDKLTPSHNRDWSPDVAVLPYAEARGDKVTLHNIRNCSYRTDDEYVVQHYDRTFDLQKIRSVDFIVVPFKEAQGLAHTMMSFGFEGDEYVCLSVEARLEKGESYSALLGAMRQFELIYVLADERDVIVRRTRYRTTDVYLYRTRANPEEARAIFQDVLRRVNKIYREPEFYDTLTNNCTTNIALHANRLKRDGTPMWDPRLLLPGYADQLAFSLGWMGSTRPFAELKAEALITAKANEFAAQRDFSAKIRR